MLATQVFGDELPDKRHGDEMTDNMETQAYVLEEEEELPESVQLCIYLFRV